MTREELIDNMVSCYDNGDAMLEYVEEYYAQRTCENCEYMRSSDSNDWCTNKPLNSQIDPDEQLDGWFTPFVGFSCSEWALDRSQGDDR